jgi:membrane protein
MRDQLLRIGKRFVAELGRDDEAGLAAELAYRFLFAIFPFGIFVAALTAFIANAIGFADPTGRIMGAVGDNLPPDVAAAIRPQLETVLGQTRPGLLTIGALAALWAATGGMQALMKALNRAWEVEETRGLIPKYALSIGLTLLGSVGLIGAFVTIVGASLLTEEVIAQLGLDRTAIDLAALLRWPLVFVLLSAAVGILYRLAPNFRAPWRWCFAGGALFSVVWILATWLFSLYLANFANYANTYGALGGVIALMLWFSLSAYILCAAAALIAAALKELQPTRVAAARVQAGSPAVPTGDRDRSGHATPSPAGTPSPSPIPPRAVAPPERRARPALPTRRRPVPAYRMSGPEDWALAGVVTVVGASIGAGLALALGASRR